MKTEKNTRIPINHWALDDQPREKMERMGRRSLSDAELIALLIRSGTPAESAVELARKVLAFANNDLNKLATFSIADLTNGPFSGIGKAKASSLIAALELGRRRKEAEFVDMKQLTNSREVFELISPHFQDLQHEECWVIILNNANCVMGKKMLSKGGRTGTVVDVKIVFELVLSYKASGIILAHNHPSGKLAPSHQDVEITNRVVKAGALLGIRVMDHLIICNNKYYSFMDSGILGV